MFGQNYCMKISNVDIHLPDTNPSSVFKECCGEIYILLALA